MEEHFGSKEALIAYINIDHVPIERLVHKLLELVRLHRLACRIRCFLIIRVELLEHILTDVAVLFLDLGCNLITVSSSKLLSTIPQRLQSEGSNVSASQRDVLHAARDYIPVADREDVSDTVAGVNDGASHF